MREPAPPYPKSDAAPGGTGAGVRIEDRAAHITQPNHNRNQDHAGRRTAQVRAWLIDDDLTPHEAGFLWVVWWHSYRTGTCTVPAETLARDCKQSPSVIYRHIARLQRRGILEVVRREGMPSRLRIIIDVGVTSAPGTDLCPPHNGDDLATGSAPPHAPSATPSRPGTHKERIEKDEEREEPRPHGLDIEGMLKAAQGAGGDA